MINLPNSIAKGKILAFALNKSLVTAAVSDPYWSDSANISKCIVVYRSTSGRQRKLLEFDFTQESPTVAAEWSAKARNSFEIEEIVLMDFDGGSYVIPRSSLPSGKGVSFDGEDVGEIVTAIVNNYAPNGAVTDVISDGNNVYVAGAFSGIGYYAPNMAKINSTTAENEILNFEGSGKFPVFNGTIRAFVLDGPNTLFVGGTFSTMDGVARVGLAKLIKSGDSWVSDTSWNEVGKRQAVAATVYSLGIYGDELYIGTSGSGCYKDDTGTNRGIYFAAVNKNTGAHIASATTANFPSWGTVTTAIEVDDEYAYFGSSSDSNGYVFARYNRETKVIDKPLTQVTYSRTNTLGIHAIKSIGEYLYIGGNTLLVNGAATIRRSIMRIAKSTFTIDTGFAPLTGSTTAGHVKAIAQTAENEIVIAGTFDWTAAYGARNIVKLNATTAAKVSAFDPGKTCAGSGVNKLIVNGSSVYAAGQFNSIVVSTDPILALNVVKLNSVTGQVDATFASKDRLANPTTDIIYDCFIDDATLMIGGNFFSWGGSKKRGVAKLKKDSSGYWKVDESFDTSTGSSGVNSILLIDNDLYICGSFTTWAGSPRLRVAKLNATSGALDPFFAVGVFTSGVTAGQFNGVTAEAYKVTTDGSSIFISGAFATYSKKSSATSTTTPTTYGWIKVDPETNTETVPLRGVSASNLNVFAIYGMTFDGDAVFLFGRSALNGIAYAKRYKDTGGDYPGFTNVDTGGTNYYYTDGIVEGDDLIIIRYGVTTPTRVDKNTGAARTAVAGGISCPYPAKIIRHSDGYAYVISPAGLMRMKFTGGVPSFDATSTWGFSGTAQSASAGLVVLGNEIFAACGVEKKILISLDKSSSTRNNIV